MAKEKIITNKYTKIGGYDERRRNLLKVLNETDLPYLVNLKDIDKSVLEFCQKKLYSKDKNGFVPCKFLGQNRFTEIMQTWELDDENGDKVTDFQILSRNASVNQGTIYNDTGNIPGDRMYSMFRRNIEHDGRVEIVEYRMKQPKAVDISYTLSLVGTSMGTMNIFSTNLINEFKAKNSYVSPNGHFMSIELENISDESEYDVNNRKFFVQTAEFTVRGYLLEESDYEKVLIPDSVSISFSESGSSKGVTKVNDNGLTFKFSKEDKNKIKFTPLKTWEITQINLVNISSFTVNNFKFNMNEFEITGDGHLMTASLNEPFVLESDTEYTILIHRRFDTQSTIEFLT